MGLGVFVALVSFFTVVHWTLIPADPLFRVFLVLCFMGNILPYVRSGSSLGMERLEWFLFNLLAVGPLCTGLLLWLNFLGHGTEVITYHTVEKVDIGRTKVTYHFADGALERTPLARSVYRDQGEVIGSTMRITQADGLLGIPVMLEMEPVASRP